MAAKKSSGTSKAAKSLQAPKVRINIEKGNQNINIREIENGYVTSESGYKGKGKSQQYYTKEVFSASNPLKTLSFGGKKK
jgi:hypothetical protein